MGRTNPTFRDRLRQFEENRAKLRRSLRQQYQRDFDTIIEHARQFADAAGYQNPREPEREILFSIILGQQTEIRELKQRVAELETETEGGENAG